MSEFCRDDCCEKCTLHGAACAGCAETGGHPCGGRCVAAEWVKADGFEVFTAKKTALIGEINALGIAGLQVQELYLLNGAYVNLAYPLENGGTVQFLKDNDVYFGAQIEQAGSERCLGVVANDAFLLVCSYGCEGADPQLLLYKNR